MIWPLFSIIFVLLVTILIIIDTIFTAKVTIEKEKTKQLENQYKINKLKIEKENMALIDRRT